MLRRERGRSAKLRKNAVDASELARQLAQDPKFRKRLASAIGHGVIARRRARRQLGLGGTVRRLASDERLLRELRSAREDLQRASRRAQRRRRSHKLRNAALVGSLAGLAAMPQVRQRVAGVVSDEKVRRDTVDRVKTVVRNYKSGRSGQPGSLEDLTRDELYARAQEADIPGRSEMSKEELVKALRGTSSRD